MMVKVEVSSGACGFHTVIKAVKEGKHRVKIEIISDCKSVEKLGELMALNGTLDLRDVLAKPKAGNPIFRECAEVLPHAACPVPIAIIKAAEVELGLAVPKPVYIQFKIGAEE
ncbi:MAG: DUF6951 family protein [Desulfomonilaceae bacterium]